VALPNNIIDALSPRITVFFPWGLAQSRAAQVFRAVSSEIAAHMLDACHAASSTELVVQVLSCGKRDIGSLSGLSAFARKGVTSLEVIWAAGQGDLTAAHLQALGAVAGQYITHLTLHTTGSIKDQVFATLWAAFPKLQRLSLEGHVSSRSTAAVLHFCAAAPHALELHLPTLGGGSHLDAHLHSTRVMLTTTNLVSE
jgi:hypothetical protein